MVGEATSGEVLEILRETFRFLVEDYGFRVDHEFAYPIVAGIMYASECTYFGVGWDLRENDLGAEFSPIDPATHRPRLATRVLLDELMALSGATSSECVRAPDEVTPESAIAAITELARLVQRYAGPLLADEWGDVAEQVAAWTASGAWRTWRAG